MKQLSAATLSKLTRALIAAAVAIAYLILAAKLGYAGKFAPQDTPASWSEVVRHLDTYVFVSCAVGFLAFLWPSHK